MNSPKYSVLMADDERPVRGIVERICNELQWNMDQVASGHEALDILQKDKHQIYIIDVRMPGPSGIDLARIILEKNPLAAVIIMTGYAELDHAVQSLKQGIFDYIQKDRFDTEEFKTLLQNAAQFHEHRKYTLRVSEERQKSFQDINTANKQFQAILELSDDMIFVLDARDGSVLDCNASACDRLGYVRNELFQMNWQDVCNEFTPSQWGWIVQSIRAKNSKVIESSIQNKQGQGIPVEISLAYVCLESGHFIAAIARDITERKHHEKIHQNYLEQLQNVLISTIETIALTVEKRDPYTAGHQKKVSYLSTLIGENIGLSKEQIKGLQLGALVHDIGKIVIPAEILSKPGRLYEEEFNLIKMHPKLGYEILKDVPFPWPIAQMVHEHHERIDGSGYPRGKKGDDILIESKILSVSDVFEAMVSHRPYRASLGVDFTINEIDKQTGKSFDPEIVHSLKDIIQKGFQFE